MASLFDHNSERTVETSIDTMMTEMEKHSHKIVGAGADSASVNMGWKNRLITKWRQVCDLKFKVSLTGCS